MKAAIRIYLIITLGLIAFVDVQMIAGPIRDEGLHGVVLTTLKPSLTLSSFANGSFQGVFDRWVSENIGLKGYLIRIENQLNYWVFGELSRNTATKITLFNKNQIYENAYIESLNRLDVVNIQKLYEKVRKIQRLQFLLKKRNIQFIFVITPSKATIYPEYISIRYIMRKRISLRSNYENIIPLLKNNHIEYLDGYQFFVNLKNKSKHDLFPNTGMHWDFYSSYLFIDNMMKMIKTNSGWNMPKIECASVKLQAFPVTPDDDLLKLSNLLYPKLLYSSYLYPVTFVKPARYYFLPRILIEGGSFAQSFIYYIIRHKCYKECEFLFYYNEKRTYEKNNDGRVSREHLYSGERHGHEMIKYDSEIFNKTRSNLRKTILSKDIVILEANEQALSNIGSGFVEDAVAALEEDNDR